MPNIQEMSAKRRKTKNNKCCNKGHLQCLWNLKIIGKCAFGALTYIYTCLCIPSYADAGTITGSDLLDPVANGAKSAGEQVYNLLLSVATPIAAIVFAYNAFQLMFCSVEEAVSAKRRMIVCAVALVVIFMSGLIMMSVVEWFPTGSSTDSWYTAAIPAAATPDASLPETP